MIQPSSEPTQSVLIAKEFNLNKKGQTSIKYFKVLIFLRALSRV